MHLIFPLNNFDPIIVLKFGRENIVQSGYTGLCVTVQLYSLHAWLAGPLGKNVVYPQTRLY